MEEKVPFSSNTFTYIITNEKILIGYLKSKNINKKLKIKNK